MTKALVILSGGQDSTTCLFWAKHNFTEVHAITFDYGQRHHIEIDAARKVAEMAGVASHEVVEVPNCLTGKSFLTDLTAPVERFESLEHMEHHNAFKENKLDSSFVPMRNVLFLTIAANRAAVLGCLTLVTGVTAADFAEYGGFSWEWLGGFVDAKGHFSESNGSSRTLRLAISQNDPELLVRLGKWVQGQLPKANYSVSGDSLYFGVRALREMAPFLTPHLHSPHRRKQAAEKGEGLSLAAEAPLTDAYVTGFWEGDGSYYAAWTKTRASKKSGKDGRTRMAYFSFFQKDPAVLEKIKDYLGRGYLGQRHTQNEIYYLQVGDGPRKATLHRRMLPHLNVLGSFEKLTKWRHAVELTAGGFNPPYPDCTPDFVRAAQETINEALRSPEQEKIQIATPVMFLTKAQSVHLAKALPGCWEAMAYSHTSYDGKYPPTDMNHANVLRAHGFEKAGLPDPLVLRAVREGLMELPMTSNYQNVQLELEF
jgi:queuosine biosynthesis protein QueC